MKLILKADDMGYTETCTDGAMMAIQEGYVTLAGIMLDTPGTEDALEKIKPLTWLSMDWVTKFWGAPVLGSAAVPSLVDENGEFWTDLLARQDLNDQELYAELEAEILRCIRLCGRAPLGTQPTGNPQVDEAKKKVCARFGIYYDYSGAGGFVRPYGDERKAAMCFESYPDYHPLATIAEALEQDAPAVMVTLQPGFLDDYVLRTTLEGPRSSISIQRLEDVKVLCSPELKALIQENQAELVTLRDVIFHKRDYQNFLAACRE